MKKRIKFVSITVGHWDSCNGRNFSLIALDEDGRVWRYLVGEGRWEQYPLPKADQ